MSESTQKPLKVICFGMGAIGTYIGGSLAANGAKVTFIEKKEFIKDAADNGIHLNINGNEKSVPNIEITSDVRYAISGDSVDVALLAVKSNDTSSVLESISGLESGFPPVLCLQNGVENEGLLARKLGEEKVIGGSITSAVGRSGLGDIKLEKLRGVGIETGHVISQKLIDWFNLSGLRAKGYESRADMKWSKMLTNLLANATSAILNWTPAQVYSDPVAWRIELSQIREALDVMKRMHIHLVDLPGTPVKPLMILLNKLPSGLSQRLIGAPLAKGRGAKMPSFHIDLYAGKTISEVTYLNGAVSRYASKVGINASVNEGLCQLLEKIAAGKIAKEEFAGQPEKLEQWLKGAKMTVPGWVQDSIFYQIFPDRFANGLYGNNPKLVVPWNSKPTIYSFHGGDLKGILDHMYYLLDLGINAIYLNPIFLSPSNHRYNAVDYFQIDPKLGTKVEFFTLLDVAHRNEMKVILDGVFNHCGRGFFAFNDVLENQADSPYTDWFNIKKFPVDAYSPGDATTYDAWWKYKSLPKFNTSNPDVEKYILKVARYWIEQGIDGWRLDVPNEINDDSFWLRFRQEVRSANPDAYLVGEIWDGDARWLGDEHFDGIMNYPLRDLVIDLLTEEIKMEQFRLDLQKWQTKYSEENAKAMYNMLGSHDVERFLTKVGGDIAKAKLGYLLLFTLLGAPAIYYGDEIGMLGGRDPDCRRTFTWDESQWMTPLRDWIKKLIRYRKQKVSLRRGTFKLIDSISNKNCLVFIREVDNECGLILINFENSPVELTVDLSETPLAVHKFLRNILSTDEYILIDKKLTVKLAPLTGGLLFP